MHFDERDAGPYRIYTAAMKRGPGYVAGVAVIHAPSLDAPTKEIFSNEALFEGRLFESAEQALEQAMHVGHDVVRRLGAVAAL